MLDQTFAGGTTFNSFYAQKFNKVGVSLYASANYSLSLPLAANALLAPLNVFTR